VTASEIASVFKARRFGRRYRAKCPIHKGRSLTLAIYSDEDRVGIHCFAGCRQDDILSVMGLSWKDLRYDNRNLTAEDKKAWAKKKYIDALYAKEQRMQDLRMLINAIENPPPRIIDTFQEDIEEFCNR
jgi:hypothetical protein